MCNRLCSTGDDARLRVVPFVNGDDPTKAPHNLSPLTCQSDVINLSSADRDRYLRGYLDGQSVGRLPVEDQIGDIMRAIGANSR
ncbi:hypothetical protein B0H34DRAFT_702417 [Crassisporium funariophilum]|nr:hypothetical protein B0H34DRAFT_702417 [Crassisporium funariophilum]